jgi:DNA (cytosine-5)-methyltransferase 1
MEYGSDKSSPPNNFWGAVDWLWCRDERWRPVEPGTFPLAYGVSGRVALLRGYGNAIVPQVAATFIRAALTA